MEIVERVEADHSSNKSTNAVLDAMMLALAGQPSGLITECADNESLRLNPSVTSFSPGEEDVIRDLCSLGTACRHIESFTENHTLRRTQEDSLYVRSLCTGMDELLDAYRQKLVDLEQEMGNQSFLALSYFRHALSEYLRIFPLLVSVIQLVRSKNLRGGRLLEYLHNRSIAGDPLEEKCLKRLLFHVNQTFCRQCTAWVVYGILSDPHKEFFVQERENGSEDESQEDREGDTWEWYHRYHVFYEMVPSYIRPVAEKVLFLGKAITVLRQPKRHRDNEPVLEDDAEEFQYMLKSIRDSPEFQPLAFEAIIDKIRAKVASHLWNLLVVDSNLETHLKSLKDYFLLSRGDFFQCILEDGRYLFMVPPSPSGGREFVNIVQRARIRSSAELDELFPLFKFTYSEARGSDSAQGEKWEDRLGLDYTVKWPLYLLFEKNVIQKYNNLLRFLLRIKRVQFELQKTWAVLMQSRHIPPTDRSDIVMKVWDLRTKMAFLIDNVQYYFQVDVLDTQFSKLLETVKSSKDFETVRRAHDLYLAALFDQFFFTIPVAPRVLESVCTKCLQFCQLIYRLDESSAGNITALWDKNFGRQASLLYTVLSGVKGVRTPNLAHFLMRISFENFL